MKPITAFLVVGEVEGVAARNADGGKGSVNTRMEDADFTVVSMGKSIKK
ncbi:hypothetical protein [Massilia sp. Mn16-1_5]|nr:hypothetical protein [Massilia sp. Mn16-1_5]